MTVNSVDFSFLFYARQSAFGGSSASTLAQLAMGLGLVHTKYTLSSTDTTICPYISTWPNLPEMNLTPITMQLVYAVSPTKDHVLERSQGCNHST